MCVCVCVLSSVTALSMSPVDATFLSSSFDMTVRFWDLRALDCQVSILQRSVKGHTFQ